MHDYVIVGAGSAGCVLAARLSEDPSVSVCLIEAGSADESEDIHIPARFGENFRTHYDWDYDTHEEPFLDRRRVYLPRGRVLGGTSSINAMLYLRSNQVDYDGWRQPGWSYRELLPYFRRSEDNERGASEYHGVGGPLAVSDGRSRNPMAAAFVAAAQQAGHPYNDDFNGPAQDGFGFFQVTQRDGRRCSTADAFLHPAMSRPNLTVELDFQVHRVLVEHGRATGVIGRRHGEEVTIRAGREVVLCAGAYNSPQLLMLSGIGPADHLSDLGIPVVVDQPQVGRNLQDHPLIPVIFTHSQPVSLLIAEEPESLRQYQEEGRGPLTSNGPECGGFVRTRAGLPAPDVAFFTGPLMFADSGLSIPTAHAITYGPLVLAPQSRGSVTLLSANPTTKPKIEHRYFSEPADMETAVAGLRIGLDIARQRAMDPYTETFHEPPASESDADLRTYVRRYTHSIFHGSGTCAMGTVVDSELRVMGVEGLRVADVSVMPTVGRGAPNASAIMIGERAADLVRDGRAPALAHAQAVRSGS
ncbi:choline dehydrogenase [Microtetraspora sp. NBRC 13810]|uniref:GMC family oxidoreductase n=1 Tax=Microtetraspora sp. NBRC 13810 TaxID=3030990 RepID=UPI0024A51800|nr:GMC family oxidoreductase N-terminal domain-containing protein [Microtetraspora sp. NBRC 13810]GLW05792.1 choline dehydrogenase [Microtetraspora sp. NBRC 13810]